MAGVSGGADSVFLLHLLHEVGIENVVVCHLHHGLRGSEADADAEFVRQLAAKLGYCFELKQADLAVEYPALGVESAGRSARRAFFAQVATAQQANTICLGHHADDRAETILFNLLRGSGTGGVSSLQVTDKQTLSGREFVILRPLLAIRAGEIRNALEQAGLNWREDASNKQPDFTRNRLRHEVIPLLNEVMSRDIVPSLLRLAAVAEAEDEWLNQQVEELALDVEISVKKFRPLPLALQRRLVRNWLAARGVNDVGFNEIDLVCQLFPADSKLAKVNLPGGRFARRRAGIVFCE